MRETSAHTEEKSARNGTNFAANKDPEWIVKTFKEFDKDNDGKLTTKDVSEMMAKTGHKVTQVNTNERFSEGYKRNF
jgi:Ca2+-binding EF-hand superfamily protein